MHQFTAYHEVNRLLEMLIIELQATLNNHLVGVYLYGSLTWGDFNEQVSDIDLLTVTETFINQEAFKALDDLHQRLIQKFPNWHDRIEIAYVGKETLKTFKTQKSNIAVISPGEAFNIKEAGVDWLINYYLIQEKSITLSGPEPTSLITPITQAEFVANVKNQALEWRQWVEHTKDSIGFQFYAVLTICRAMYALDHGKQGSKIVAANWAKMKFPKWTPLIDQALAFRSQANTLQPDESRYPEVKKFVFEMLGNF